MIWVKLIITKLQQISKRRGNVCILGKSMKSHLYNGNPHALKDGFYIGYGLRICPLAQSINGVDNRVSAYVAHPDNHRSRHGWHFAFSWWRHQMDTFSALLVLCEGNPQSPVDSPHKGQWRQGFDVFFDLRLNKRLSKQSRRRGFETSWHSLWRHCYVLLWFGIGRCW